MSRVLPLTAPAAREPEHAEHCMSPEQTERELARIYAEIPAMNCKQLCQECCGPIPATRLEFNRMVDAFGSTPEHRELRVKAESGQDAGNHVYINCVTCPMLRDGKCSVYDVRPLICRLWGTTQRLRCPFGCTPQRWLSDRDAFKLIERARKLSEKCTK
jgi:uncharacterized protein